MKFSKGKSTGLFLILLILIVAMGFVAAVGVGKTKTGSAENIILGLDLKGGVSVTYQIKDEDYTKEQVEDTKYKLELRVANFSTESEVYTEGDDKITVDIPGTFDAQTVIDELGKPGSLMFVTEADADFEDVSGVTPDRQKIERKGAFKKQTPGSNAFVPSVAGMIIAAEVVKDLTQFHVTDLFKE